MVISTNLGFLGFYFLKKKKKFVAKSIKWHMYSAHSLGKACKPLQLQLEW